MIAVVAEQTHRGCWTVKLRGGQVRLAQRRPRDGPVSAILGEAREAQRLAMELPSHRAPRAVSSGSDQALVLGSGLSRRVVAAAVAPTMDELPELPYLLR